MNRRHLLGIRDLAREEMLLVLDQAEALKEILDRPIKKVPTLRGRTVVSLFLEPSTRTRLSFELAAKRLGADTVGISKSSSSVVKGEDLIDTARNIEAMRPDVLVVRHSMSGAPHLLARHVGMCVVNGGDGTNEHPTQALLDCFTVRERLGTIEGLKVAIMGDILHSRVAHSDILAFSRLGAEVVVSGPATMLPPDPEALGCRIVLRREDAVAGADVIIGLRIQKERQGRSLFPSVREYARCFGIDDELLDKGKKNVLIMHPGPINRGVEMSPQVADAANSAILDQVTNGVAVRMAVLSLLLSGADAEAGQ